MGLDMEGDSSSVDSMPGKRETDNSSVIRSNYVLISFIWVERK